MNGTRRAVAARDIFAELPFPDESSPRLFSSDSSTSSDSSDTQATNLNMSGTVPPILDLTNPFAGVIDLKDKVGL